MTALLDALDAIIERAPGIISGLIAVFWVSAFIVWGLTSAYVFETVLGFDLLPSLDVLPDYEIEGVLDYIQQLLNY